MLQLKRPRISDNLLLRSLVTVRLSNPFNDGVAKYIGRCPNAELDVSFFGAMLRTFAECRKSEGGTLIDIFDVLINYEIRSDYDEEKS